MPDTTQALSEWTMPVVEPGDIVLFSRDLSDRSTRPAIVRYVYERVIEIVLVGGGNYGLNQVRHRDDPFLVNRPDLIADSGVFVVAPCILRMRTIEATLTDLMMRLSKLEKTRKAE